MRPIDRLFISVFALGMSHCLLATVTYAQSNDESGLCDIATVQIDNDETGGTDRHYTGGVRVACVTSPPQLVRDLILREPSDRSIHHSRATYAVGQSVFTPDDIRRSEPNENDQPYAGWLYLGFNLEREIVPKSDSLRYLDNIELQLGVIGPLSGAEQVQRIGHDLTNATDPQGWDNQLDNEPGINLFYSRQWTGAKEIDLTPDTGFPGLFFDVTPKLGGALGNIHIFGAGGLTFRLGNFLPDDHGPSAIRPRLPGSDYFPRQEGISAYVFGGLEGRVVGRNIFLDGNTFQDNGPSVDKNTLVGEAHIGLALTIDNVRLAYTHVFRSREFKEQSPQTFGSLTVSLGF